MSDSVPTTDRTSRRSLASDERGSILVLGLFASALLIALLFFVVGMGHAIRQRGRLQDPADAGAHGMAVMHARAMNLVALMNLTKASAAGVMAAMRAIALGAAAGIPVAIAHRDYGEAAELASILFRAASRISGHGGEAREVIRAAGDVQEALHESLPALSESLASEMVSQWYAPPLVGSFAWPLRRLPVEEGSALPSCARVSHHSLGVIDDALDGVGGAGGRVARAVANGSWLGLCVGMKPTEYRITRGSKLGREPFQVRFFVTGKQLSSAGESGVKVASWSHRRGRDTSPERHTLSRFAFAEGEHYFDADLVGLAGTFSFAVGGLEDSLWHLAWRPRLRRFRLPEDTGGTSGFRARCTKEGGNGELCGSFASLLPEIAPMVVH